MTARFGEGAARLAGMAGATLGWGQDQFWRATPAELSAVLMALMPPDAQGVAQDELRSLMEQFPDG